MSATTLTLTSLLKSPDHKTNKQKKHYWEIRQPFVWLMEAEHEGKESQSELDVQWKVDTVTSPEHIQSSCWLGKVPFEAKRQ